MSAVGRESHSRQFTKPKMMNISWEMIGCEHNHQI